MPEQRDLVTQLRQIIETQRLINMVALDVNEIMRVVTERSQMLTGADGAVVELADGYHLVCRAASGSAAGRVGDRLEIDNSLSGSCVRRRVPIRCDDTDHDPRVDTRDCRSSGCRSVVGVPLMHRGLAVGVLKVMSGRRSHFNDADVGILSEMAGFIADALANASDHGEENRRATHDRLTGLPNRELLTERLQRAVRRSRRTGGPGVGVFFIDLDGFKAVNDTYGHPVGDEVLRRVATELRSVLREGDTLARLGGDEFVLLCESAGQAVGPAIRDRISAALGRVAGSDPRFAGLGASVGSAWSDGQRSAMELLAAADASMYRSKRTRTGAPAGASPDRSAG